ncbi:PD-(D/E)XK nuclease family protein [Balneola sp. MJW-20]|uniref:PDDEXK-like family protein n=1 Tax=Gracilimonas aurantiaca TaxID=3234185 RepID=UPI003464ECBA
MQVQGLKQKYTEFINDITVDELELSLKVPNIFEVLSISHNEIRHSNFLGWILNPKGNHGLDDIFLKRILRDIFSSDMNEDVDQIEVSELDYSDIEIRREWRNIDLLILFSDIVVCIENKVYSKEHSDQLSRYKKIVESEFPSYRKVFVYLTPYGDNSSEENTYIPISYESIESHLKRILDIHSGSVNQSVINYIEDYLTILRRELMGNDKTIELSNRIYRTHKELLDFIFEHRPDYLDEVNNSLREIIRDKEGFILGHCSKTSVRFTTPKIQELIYNNEKTTGWSKDHGEVFQFQMRLEQNKDQIIFKTVIAPGTDDYDRERLSEILQGVKGFKKPSGKQWLVNYMKKQKFDFESVNELSEGELSTKLNRIVSNLHETVMEVEKKLVEHEDELLKLKNI